MDTAQREDTPVTYRDWESISASQPSTYKRTSRSLTLLFLAALLGAVAGGLVSYPVAQRAVRHQPLFSLPNSNSRSSASNSAAPGTIAAIVENIRPSIVAIGTESVSTNLFLEAVPSEGAGTGIVLDSDGHILTNNHVVSGAQKISVTTSDGRTFPAKVVGVDSRTDLAVISIDASGLKPASFGDSGSLKVGDSVVAIGQALALPGGPTVTEGIVSALDRSIQEPNGVTLENLIQTDAAINPGNSGGALLDSTGSVVGVNTAIAGNAQNIGFAIAITPAKEVVNQLIATGKVVRPFLGVTMVTITPEIATRYNLSVKVGALILQVQSRSGADNADLRPGDAIVEVEGRKVTKSSDVSDSIASKKPGDALNLVIARGSSQLKVKAILSEGE